MMNKYFLFEKFTKKFYKLFMPHDYAFILSQDDYEKLYFTNK